MGDVDVLILCGGLGSRLRSVIGESQKVMADVEGKPFLDYHMMSLKKQDFGRVILCTGYQANDVQNYYRKYDHDLIIDFSQEDKPLGTGGAMKQAEMLVESEHFFLLNGDSFCDINYAEMLKQHKETEALITVAVSTVEDARDYGAVVIDDNKRIIDFIEKGKTSSVQAVNAGVYCFDSDVFEMCPEEEKFSLEYDIFPKVMEEGLYAYVTSSDFFDIGTPDRLKKAKQIFG